MLQHQQCHSVCYRVKPPDKFCLTNAWSNPWHSLSPFLIAFKPDVSPAAYGEEPRNIQVPISRIRLCTTNLTHGHYRSKVPLNKSHTCDIRNIIHHIIIDCSALTNQRQVLTNYCLNNNINFILTNLIKPPFPASLIHKFLQDIGYIKEI